MHSISLKPHEFDCLQGFIEDSSGIRIEKEKSYILENRLPGLMEEEKCASFHELCTRLAKGNDRALLEKVIDLITTNETLWFRDQSPWRIMADLLPGMIDQMKKGTRGKIRIWSAGCSTGQEPYSTAMFLDQYLTESGITAAAPEDFEIIGTDISGRVLQTAKSGIYDDISISRGLSEELRSRYFINKGREWHLADRIKNRVKFRAFNLQNSFSVLGRFDFIFCRYVTIYFSKDFKKDVLKRYAETLNPKGVLFLGSSEVFSDFHENFDMRSSANGVFYVVKDKQALTNRGVGETRWITV